MIKDFIPRAYDGVNGLPTYVGRVSIYTIIARVAGGYDIVLAKLTVGESVSAGKILSHALFESFTDHGVRSKTTRTRASGYDREFNAVKNAMIEAGVEFLPMPSSATAEIIGALGEWFATKNGDIESYEVDIQAA